MVHHRSASHRLGGTRGFKQEHKSGHRQVATNSRCIETARLHPSGQICKKNELRLVVPALTSSATIAVTPAAVLDVAPRLVVASDRACLIGVAQILEREAARSSTTVSAARTRAIAITPATTTTHSVAPRLMMVSHDALIVRSPKAVPERELTRTSIPGSTTSGPPSRARRCVSLGGVLGSGTLEHVVRTLHRC